MNGILGFSEMLLDANLNEEQKDYVQTIKRSGESLLSLVNDILDFSKIEAGQLDFEEIEFDPELLAYDVCKLIRPKIESKQIEVLCRIGDNLPSMVKGDPLRFRQVLTNLMGNAQKFTEAGEIELSIEVEEEEEDRMKLHVKIRDTGIGIPKDKLAAIFEPFQQEDGSTTRKYGGTGLGLSICKKISELIGGKVWAESPADGNLSERSGDSVFFEGEAGKLETGNLGKAIPLSAGSTLRFDQQPATSNQQPGSIFHFTAWLGKAEANETKKITPVSLSNKKALIVDDNRNNLEILRHILESVGINVVALTKGEDVVPALEKGLEAEKPFDLCISDIQMPEMSGYDVAKAIRSFESKRSWITNMKFKWLLKDAQSSRGHKLQSGLYSLALNLPKFSVLYVASDDYRTLHLVYDTKDIKDEVDTVIDVFNKTWKLKKIPIFEVIEKWQSNLMYNSFPDWVNHKETKLNEIAKRLFKEIT